MSPNRSITPSPGDPSEPNETHQKISYRRPATAIAICICLCVVSIMVGFYAACGVGGGGNNYAAAAVVKVIAFSALIIFLGSVLTIIGSVIWLIVIAITNANRPA